MSPRKVIKIILMAVGELHTFRFTPVLLFWSKFTSGLWWKDGHCSPCWDVKDPSKDPTTAGVARGSPWCREAKGKGRRRGLSPSHLAAVLLGVSLLIFSGVTSPQKACANSRLRYKPQAKCGLRLVFPVSDTTVCSIKAWYTWTWGHQLCHFPGWEGKSPESF